VSTRPQSTTLVCSLLDLKKAELPDIFIKIAPKKVENAQKNAPLAKRRLKRLFYAISIYYCKLRTYTFKIAPLRRECAASGSSEKRFAGQKFTCEPNPNPVRFGSVRKFAVRAGSLHITKEKESVSDTHIFK
jgi:hypothetical protein